jgi:hypothetical protein
MITPTCCVLRPVTKEVASTFLVILTNLVAFTWTMFCSIQDTALFYCHFHWPTSFLETTRYKWRIVSSSRGGTGAVHFPVLNILIRIGTRFTCTLADIHAPGLTMSRFQLGSQAANQLLNTPNLRRMLDENCATKLNDFITQLGDRSAPDRTYALLGQSYFSQVMYCQMDDVAIALSKDF